MNTKAFLIKIVQVLSILFLAVTLYINYLSSNQSINGVTIKDVSDANINLFTPAPVTFIVWAFIYLGLIMYAIWQVRTVFSDKYQITIRIVVERIGILFLLTCVFNSAWIFAWHYEKLFISTILIIALLMTLIEINRRISFELPDTPQYKLFLKVPFGMYLGWISIATISNVAAYLTKVSWQGWGLDPRFWQMFMVVLGTAIACWSVIKLNNIAYGIVVIWGLGGILMVRINDTVPSLAIMGLITLCALIILFTIMNRLKYWAPKMPQIVEQKS